MRELTTTDVENVSGALSSGAEAFNIYADVLLAGGLAAVSTGVFAGAGAFAIGLGGSIKIGIALWATQ